MADGNMQSFVLLTISEREWPAGSGKGWGTWVIGYAKDGAWIIKGKNQYARPCIKLVCGEFYTDTASGEKRYAAKGLETEHLESLKARWLEIEKMLKSPPPIEDVLKALDKPAADAGPSKMPWEN